METHHHRHFGLKIFFPFVSAFFLFAASYASVRPNSAILGIHPLDEKYFSSEVIKCKDGSKSFTRDRLNDNFCDCVDGTDEPDHLMHSNTGRTFRHNDTIFFRTSACPAGKFYCRNAGSAPQFIFSSHINDHFCDCCDGSDEYDGSINCPNTCVMGGNIEYKTEKVVSTISDLRTIDAEETKIGVNLQDLIEKLKGLKIIIILQVVLICGVVVCRKFHRRVRSKRRRYRKS